MALAAFRCSRALLMGRAASIDQMMKSWTRLCHHHIAIIIYYLLAAKQGTSTCNIHSNIMAQAMILDIGTGHRPIRRPGVPN